MNGDMKKFTHNFKTKPKKPSLSAGEFKCTFLGIKKIPKGRNIPVLHLQSFSTIFFGFNFYFFVLI